MLSTDEAIAQFKEILGSKEGWQYLKDSQFFAHLAIFQAWALRAAQFDAERTLQEFFLSTALNRSSIAAQAEDKGYLPRLPVPSTGQIQITNKGKGMVAIPALQAFQSNTATPYLIKYPLIVMPGESATVTVYQLAVQTVIQSIVSAEPFIEILFDRQFTEKISQVDVYVDAGDGAGYVQWELSRQFMNTTATSKAFDLFYSHDGQMGVRFGNGVFGKIPAAGNSVKCVLWLTEGDTVLLENLKIPVSGTIYDDQGQIASLEIKAVTQVSGGSNIEGTEELRRNLMYWPLYNDSLVWREDYEFFLRRKLPSMLWVKVWGEAEAEVELGSPNMGFINGIFVSAYIPGEENTESLILDAFNSIKIYNRRITWIAPEFVTADITVTGKISRSRTAESVKAAVTAALTAAYGKDSTARRDQLFIKDVYKIIADTGNFNDSGASFTVSISGATQAEKLKQMLCLGTLNITLEYI